MYYLIYNAAAMFAINAEEGMFEKIGDTGAEGFDAACHIAAIMAQQGELVRRYEGYDKGRIPDADLFRLTATPKEALEIKKAIIMAVQRGIGQEVESDKDVDLGLERLAAKNKKK